MTSITIRSPIDYQRAVRKLKTADRYERSALLEAMLHYDCVTHPDRTGKTLIDLSELYFEAERGEDAGEWDNRQRVRWTRCCRLHASAGRALAESWRRWNHNRAAT